MTEDVNRTAENAEVTLAHEKPFRLGRVTVHPAMRELVGDDGRREQIEPRVMEVLVALWRADGAPLTKDDLIHACWRGRIVGDDAIDRVIGRLRRALAGIGDNAFRIETITKVGHRLVPTGAGSAPAPLGATMASAPRPSRRILIAGGAGAAVAAVGGGLVWRARHAPPLDRATQALYDQGWTALCNTGPEQLAQAVGLFRKVVAAAPTYADGWGALAYAYAAQAAADDPVLGQSLQANARAAAERALQLSPGNALGQAALVSLKPVFRNWLASEAAYSAALKPHPDVAPLLIGLATVLFSVGRARESAVINDREMKISLPSPSLMFRRVLVLTAANRLEEADRAAALAMDTFPRNVPVWFTTFLFYMRTGRPERAIAFGLDRSARPASVPDHDFDIVLASAQAIQTQSAPDIDRAMSLNLEAAHRGAGYTENAIQLAAMVGRLDTAFELARAYFFRRPTARGFSSEQGIYYREPRTIFLFAPSNAPMREDPRFDGLVDAIGLKAYWEKSGHKPDFMAARPA
ncbi:MAG: winged helix-turn-helix domain-containing protein [Phenylobacterium sp.]